MEELRILLSAYACEPGRGSEPGVGWNWVGQLARSHEVWVITRANNRVSIEAALAKDPLSNAHFVYFDLPRWASFWKKGRRGIHLYYYLWQLGVYFVGRELHRQAGFDLVHHVTFVNYWMPSFLAMLPAPFVWGPVGGGESAPRAFWFSYGLRGKFYETVRDLARVWGWLDPFVRLTARRAALGLATTTQTQRRLLGLGCPNNLIFSEAGLPADEIQWLGSFPVRQSNPFRLVSLGNLLHLKGYEFALKAFARFQQRTPASEYWLIGEGPERPRLEKLARELGVSGKVIFWGAMPRPQALEKLAHCDVLVHPSLHDSGGWVCLEAMAAGRPVVCLDLGGPAVQVTEQTGIKVPAVSPEQVVRDLTAALHRLAGDAALRLQAGQAGRRRVQEHFAWEKKGESLNQLYRRFCLAGRA